MLSVQKGAECSLDPPPSGVITAVGCNGQLLVVCTFSGVFFYDTTAEPFVQKFSRIEGVLRQSYKVACCKKRNGDSSRYVAVAAGTSREGDGHCVSVISPGYNFVVSHNEHGANRITSLILSEVNDGKFVALSGDAKGTIVLLDITRGTSHLLFTGDGHQINSMSVIPRTKGLSLVVATKDTVFLHHISSTWQGEKSIPILLEEGTEAPLCPCQGVFAMGRNKCVTVIDEDGNDVRKLKATSSTLQNRVFRRIMEVERTDGDLCFIVQTNDGDTFILKETSANTLSLFQYVFCASKFRKERQAEKDVRPLTIGLGMSPGATRYPAVFMGLSDGRTILYVVVDDSQVASSPKLREPKHSESTSRASFIDAVSMTMNKFASRTTTALDTITSQPLTKVLAESLAGATNYNEATVTHESEEMSTPETNEAPEDETLGSDDEKKMSPRPIVVQASKRVKVKKIVKKNKQPYSQEDDALAYVKERSAALEEQVRVERDMNAASEQQMLEELAFKKRVTDLTESESKCRNSVLHDEREAYSVIFSQHSDVTDLWNDSHIRRIKQPELHSATHLRHVCLTIPDIRKSNTWVSSTNEKLLPTKAQLLCKEFVDAVSKRQQKERALFEVADLKLRQKAELDALIDVEEVEVEENERKDQHGEWKSFKIRFQLPEDGSEVDLDRLNSMQCAEWSWLDGIANEGSEGCSGYPEWRTGVWKYARVWPSCDPAEEASHWTSEYQLLSIKDMRVRRRSLYRKQVMTHIHRKKEALKLQHEAQLLELMGELKE